LLSKNRKGIQESLSEKLEESIEYYVYTGCQKGVNQEWLSILIWNYKEMVREIINWPKSNIYMVLLLLQVAPLLLPPILLLQPQSYI
jgi:hypothetical protein